MADGTVSGYPLSPQQRRLYALSDGDGAFPYRARCQVLISGPLDPRRLRRAAEETVSAHEILRTAFTPCPGLAFPLQVISEAEAFSPRWSPDRDLSGRSEDERQAVLDSAFEEAGSRAAGPGGGPLLELALFRLGRERHALVLGLPALCADAAGMTSLVRAIGQRYSGHQDPAEPLQYADLASWLNDVAEAREAAGAWRDRANEIAAGGVSAPFERPGSPTAFRPGSAEVPLPPGTAARLAALAGQAQVSVSSLLLTAWLTLLWRHGGAGIAVTADGRDDEQLAGVVGLLARQLPAPVEVDGRESFRALARRVEQTVRDRTGEQASFSWDHGPGGGPPRFFPVAYEFGREPAPWSDGGIGWEIARRSADVDRYRLRLTGREHVGGLTATIGFDTSCFRAQDVRQLADQLRVLLGHATEDPGAPVEQLRLLSDGERGRLVTAFNATEAAIPERTVAELFGEQAGRTPDALAVVSGSAALSYAALETRSSQLAHRLRELDVRPETPVAIVMERSAELLVAILGVLKAGGAFVPLDPSHPPQRLAFLLSDADPRVVLTQRSLSARWAEDPLVPYRDRAVFLDTSGACLSAEPLAPPLPPRSPDEIAYVIYTSGSTGEPKGVQVTHQGLINYLTWATGAYDVSRGDGAPVDGPVAVDLAITGLLCPLLAGRTVVLVPGGQATGRVSDVLLDGHDYSLVKLTPLALDLLRAEPDAVQAAHGTRAFIIGGENLPASSVAFWREHAPGTRLVNEYGPTETVVGCCVYTVGQESPATGSVPIGRPIANMRLYVLDPAMQPVPAGVAGEIYIGGAGVARGYRGQPGLTAGRFVPDPFSAAPGGRLYRTGDLGRFLLDGNLECLGRNDDQVKIRGDRVEPGEVEAALRSHPEARGVVVTGHEFGPDDRRLVAYVVAAGSADADEFRRFLTERLPEHLVPSVFMLVDALPVAASGKVDRSRLPEPRPNRDAVDREFTAPRTPLEVEIAALFADVLQLDRVGLNDNFFELGGTSILIVQLNNRLASSYGMDRNMTQILRAPTVADTAQMISMAQQSGRDAVLGTGVDLAALDARLDESIDPDYGPAHLDEAVR